MIFDNVLISPDSTGIADYTIIILTCTTSGSMECKRAANAAKEASA